MAEPSASPLQAGTKSVPITEEISVWVDHQVDIRFGFTQVPEGLGTAIFSSTTAFRSQGHKRPTVPAVTI